MGPGRPALDEVRAERDGRRLPGLREGAWAAPAQQRVTMRCEKLPKGGCLERADVWSHARAIGLPPQGGAAISPPGPFPSGIDRGGRAASGKPWRQDSAPRRRGRRGSPATALRARHARGRHTGWRAPTGSWPPGTCCPPSR